MKKTGFKFQQHKTHGADLNAARDSLFRLSADARLIYGPDSELAYRTATAIDSLNSLRLVLADAAGCENPQVPTSDIFNLYFPTDLDKKTVEKALPEPVNKK